MDRGRFTLKGFQRSMLIRFIVIAAIGGVISTLLFYLITRKKLDEILYTFHLPRSIDDVLLSYVIIANLTGLFFVIISLVLSMKSTFWKVTGPLFRMSQDIQKLIDGDLAVNIRLRKDDEFKDIAEDFDSMGKEMKERFMKIKEKFSELSITAAYMGVHMDEIDLLREKNMQLKKNIDELHEGLDAFKI
jgi:methyl-accepting chemotaxis protein